MRCRRVRHLMQECLDGTLSQRGELDRHLAECGACRAEFSALQSAHDAVAAVAAGYGDKGDAERDVQAVMSTIRARRPLAPTPPRARAVALAAGMAALLVAFSLGLWAGRAAWPREVPVTRVVIQPRIVEKTVEVPVEVPVVKERVVVRHVPVVRTKVVYRDRPVAADSDTGTAENRKLFVRVADESAIRPPVVSEEFRPAKAVGEAGAPRAPEQATDEKPQRVPGHLPRQGSRAEKRVAQAP